MTPFEKKSFESPSDSIKPEIEEKKEEEFDPEKIKTEYAETRLEYIKSEVEYNRLSEERLKIVDALIANPEDEAVKKNFWEVSDNLDKIMAQREELARQQVDLSSQLLINEDGGKNLEAGISLFFDRFKSFIKENPELAKWLHPENLEFQRGAENIESLSEKLERLKELSGEIEALKDRFASLKRKDEELVQKFNDSFRTGADLEGLKMNVGGRKEIAVEMKLVNIELEEKRIGLEAIAGSM